MSIWNGRTLKKFEELRILKYGGKKRKTGEEQKRSIASFQLLNFD